MFDLSLPIHPTAYARGVPPHFPTGDADPSHPFALTLSRRAPADLMSGRAAPAGPRPLRDAGRGHAGRDRPCRGYRPGCRAPASGDPRSRRAPRAGRGRQRRRRRLVPSGDERGRGAGRRDRGEPAARAGRPRGRLGRARSGAAAASPRRSSRWRASSIRSGAPSPPGRCRSRRDARETEEGRGDLELVRGREIARPGSDPFPFPETPDDPELNPPSRPRCRPPPSTWRRSSPRMPNALPGSKLCAPATRTACSTASWPPASPMSP